MLYDDETLDWLITKLDPVAVECLDLLSSEWVKSIRITNRKLALSLSRYPGMIERRDYMRTYVYAAPSGTHFDQQRWCYSYRLTSLGLQIKVRLKGS